MTVDLAGMGDEFLRFWSERQVGQPLHGAPGRHCARGAGRSDRGREAGLARVITSGDSYKARQALAAGAVGVAVAVCQVDGRHWSTLEGRAVVRSDAESVADAERRYAERYRVPRPNPRRVVLEIAVSRVLGSW